MLGIPTVSGIWTPECQSPTFLVFLTVAVTVENMYESSWVSGKTCMTAFPLISVTVMFQLGMSRLIIKAVAAELHLCGSQNSSQEHTAIFLSQLSSLKFSGPLEGSACLQHLASGLTHPSEKSFLCGKLPLKEKQFLQWSLDLQELQGHLLVLLQHKHTSCFIFPWP